MFAHMIDDCGADSFGQPRRNSIPDEPAQRSKLNRLIGSYKIVIAWEALQDCGLPEADCAMLLGARRATCDARGFRTVVGQ